ncbi:MAG: YceI family protein [Burkholderiales bacterium]
MNTAVLAEPTAAEVSVAPDAPRFAVDGQASEIRLLVYRDGPLARFGHNHVFVGRVEGEIRAGDTATGGAFRLEIPVGSFAVDPAAARAEEGADFAAEVSEQTRQATRENMLGEEVLDAGRHPLIRIASVALAGPRWNPTVTARVTLRGVSRDVRFPAAVFWSGDALEVIASFRLRQSDFGIKPFAALGGGLLVHDAIDIRVRVLARRAMKGG